MRLINVKLKPTKTKPKLTCVKSTRLHLANQG